MSFSESLVPTELHGLHQSSSRAASAEEHEVETRTSPRPEESHGLHRPSNREVSTKEPEAETRTPSRLKKFVYTPLPRRGGSELGSGNDSAWIRVAELQPGSWDDVISCRLVEQDLATCDAYSAISYCWYRDENARSMQVEDKTPSRSRHMRSRVIRVNDSSSEVTPNLYDALQHLRDEKEAIRIWVDGICINQSDDLEKSEQVALMRQIYARAVRTIVWLGRGSEDTESGVRLLSRLRKLQEEGQELIKIDRLQLESFGLPLAGSAEWEALRGLLNDPYWKRSWIVQELVVSGSIIIRVGLFELDWRDLEIFDKSMHLFGGTATVHASWARIKATRDLEESYRGHKSLNNLDRLLLRFYSHRATDPRDKIYGLLGIATDHEALQIEPEYRKTTREVYVDATRNIARYGKTLECLIFAGTRDVRIDLGAAEYRTEKIEGLPSWCPDWNDLGDRISPLRKSVEPNQNFQASGKRRHVVEADDRDDELTVEGCLVDTAVALGQRFIKLGEDRFTQGLQDWERVAMGATKYSSLASRLKDEHDGRDINSQEERREANFQAFYATLTTSVDHNLQHEVKAVFSYWLKVLSKTKAEMVDGRTALSLIPEPETRGSWYDQLYDILENLRLATVFTADPKLPVTTATGSQVPRTRSDLWLPDGPKPVHDMFYKVTTTGRGRVICLTEHGYMALVPNSTLAGDRVAVLAGCSVPVILREVRYGTGAEEQNEGERDTNDGVAMHMKTKRDEKDVHGETGTGLKEDKVKKWKVVGAAFVTGIMEGEAWDEDLKETLRLV